MKIQDGELDSSPVMDGVEVGDGNGECVAQKDEQKDERSCEKQEQKEEPKDESQEGELLPDIGPDIGEAEAKSEADADTNEDDLCQSSPLSTPADKSDDKIQKIAPTCDVCGREFKNMRGKRIHEFTCRKAAAKAKAPDDSIEMKDSKEGSEDGDIKNYSLKEQDAGDNKSYNLRESSTIFYDENSEEGGDQEPAPVTRRKRIHYTRKGFKKRVRPDKHGKYPCPYCQKKLANGYTLKIHMRFHTGEKPFSCPQCDERFERQDYVERHAVVHSGADLKEPKLKEKVAPRRYKLKRLNNAPPSSTVSNILKKLRLNTVKYKNVPPQKREFQCTHCEDVSFAKQYHLENHMRYVHNGLKPFPCTVCGEGFSRRDYLLKHTFKCPALKGSNRVDEKDLADEKDEEDDDDDDEEEEEDEEKGKDKVKSKVRHVEEPSSADEKFDCPECGKVLSSKINLRGHMVQHTGRGIPCPDCNKNFGRRSNMLQHRANVHGWPAKNTSPFSGQEIVCTECGEVFPNTVECLAHMNKFHEKMDRKVAPLKLKLNGKMSKQQSMFSCKLCDLEFVCEQLLTEHNEANHADISKKLKCKLCDRFFTHQHNLSSHMAHKHRGRRPFVCPQCKKTFIMAHHMTAHIRYVHAANKPYPCKHCDRSYMFRSELQRHMKAHSGKTNLNGVQTFPKLESKFNPFLEEDDDESLFDDEDDVMVVDADAVHEKPNKDVEPEEKDMEVENSDRILDDVEISLRMQLSEQKRTFEAELERALEEQRCLANKRIEIYKNVVENLQEKNAKATKLIAGVKSVLKDMSKQLLTKDQTLSEYEDRINKYKNRVRRIEESETELRIALEELENGKKGHVNGSSKVAEAAVADGESAVAPEPCESDAATPDRYLLKQKVKSSWLKLSDRIRNKSTEVSENDAES